MTPPSAFDEPSSPSYPSEGRLVNALADHFGQGFDANFDDAFRDDFSEDVREEASTRFAPDPVNEVTGNFHDDFRDGFEDGFQEDEGHFSGAFNRRLARQFTGEDFDAGELNAALDADDEEHERPIGLRSLQWIRRNMTSLRIIVSLQRVTPPDQNESRPRKASGE